MAEAKGKKKRLFRKLKNKYRLVIMNDETFEEKTSIRLTPMNVFVSVGSFLIVFTTLLTYIIAGTPLREYIPGYADVNLQRQVRTLSEQVEDIRQEIDANDLYIQNINNVVAGKPMQEVIEKKQTNTAKYDSIRNLPRLGNPISDSILIEQLKSQVPIFSEQKKKLK